MHAVHMQQVPAQQRQRESARQYHAPAAGGHHHAHDGHHRQPEVHVVDPSFLAQRTWQDPTVVRLLSPATQQALAQVFQFDRMTKVQDGTLDKLLAGRDCLVKAKTGGGKTLAFLIPAIERLAALRAQQRGGAGRLSIGMLVVSPARELAMQILREAEKLLSTHPGGFATAVIGGRNIKKEQRVFEQHADVRVLVGTPGRLCDHIEHTNGFAAALQQAHVLVLDEADNLLQMGFKPQLDQILNQLRPNSGAAPRQSALVSATMPKSVLGMARNVLRPGYDIVDTTGGGDSEGGDDAPTLNAQVKHEALVVPAGAVSHCLAWVLQRYVALNPQNYKAIVFFPTARQTAFMAALFSAAGLNVLEVHSRRSQAQRDKASNDFRSGSNVVMFSSDVSARGMDYPGVGLVVQVGITSREQYIHRLGRTGRAGGGGQGLLLVADYEAPAMLGRELSDLDIARVGAPGVTPAPVSEGLIGPGGQPAFQQHPQLARVLATVADSAELQVAGEKAYQAWLGFYRGSLKALRWDAAALVAEGNSMFAMLGLREVPQIEAKTLGKMGLRGVPGIREAPRQPGGGGGGGRGGGHGGGRQGGGRQ